MKTISFYGASDDLIEVDFGDGKKEEYSAYRSDEEVRGSFTIGTKMRVHAVYGATNGCWSFAISPEDEGIPIPDWPIRFSLAPDCPYSTLLEIDVPDDIRVVKIGD